MTEDLTYGDVKQALTALHDRPSQATAERVIEISRMITKHDDKQWLVDGLRIMAYTEPRMAAELQVAPGFIEFARDYKACFNGDLEMLVRMMGGE